jgi:HAD superfamily hydrolase (TIGR01509 family)
MTVRGVIFDMGGTLLHYSPPGQDWEAMEKLGAQGVYYYLKALDYELPPEEDALEEAWPVARDMWQSINEDDVSRIKLGYQVTELARRWGVTDLEPEQLEALAEAYMKGIQTIVSPLEGAVETLEALRERNLRIGLISNTLWEGRYHRSDLDRWGLTPYLEVLIFSADVQAWKPYRAVFEQALKALELAPEEAVFVGDSLYYDIYGAKRAGLRGVWIEQPWSDLPEGIEVTPDATIRQLPELVPLVDRWRDGVIERS